MTKLQRQLSHKTAIFPIQSGRHRFITPPDKYRLEWGEEQLSGQIGKAKLGRGFNLRKIAKLLLLVIVCLGLLLSRVYWLTVVKGAYYQDLSEGNRVRLVRQIAKRGIIYDRQLKPLVNNTANWILYLIPADLPSDFNQRQILLQHLSALTPGLIISTIEQQLSEAEDLAKYQPLVIAENLTYEQAMLLYLKTATMPGVVLASSSRRHYNLNSLSWSPLLGYTGKISPEELKKLGSEYAMIDEVGKTGLEYFYESELRGHYGVKQIEVDALGKEKKILSTEAPEDGHNLILSLDNEVQNRLAEILQTHLQKLGLSRAVAIVMNPNNGEILAMVNLPTFDNNLFAQGISAADYQSLAKQPDKPLFMRAIAGEYPSGSTIKPVVLAAGLQEGAVTASTSFLSVGGIRIGQWFFPDWKAGGHGLTDARQAIAESVNTYFYYLSGGYQDFVGLGIDRLAKYFKMFGLGGQTGIDLSGEASGFIPNKQWKKETKKESWYIGDTYHTAIGQGDLLVTPLQVAYYTVAFANGGTLYRPHLVKEILTGDDQLILQTDITPVKTDFIEAQHIAVVRAGMRQAVTAGSAIRLNSLPVAVAGKTGTAQWSTQKPTHAWFTGFAPYDNPQITITILIEEGGEGSSIAVRIAEQFLYWYFTKNLEQ